MIPELYIELLFMVRKMFLECKLVHADLSEYNILYHVEDTPSSHFSQQSQAPTAPDATAEDERAEDDNAEKPRHHGHLYIIDVSQSVEHDHPHAFDFLRSDLRNIEDFFSKRGAHCVGLRRAFEFVTRESLSATAEDLIGTLRRWMEEPDTTPEDGEDHGEAALEDAVFMKSYIPRTLNEVYDPERDVGALSRGEGAQLIYKDVIGLVTPDDTGAGKSAPQNATNGSKVRFQDDASAASEGEGVDASENGEEPSDSESDEATGKFEDRPPRGHRHEDKEAKKVRLIVFAPHGPPSWQRSGPRGSLFVIAGLIAMRRSARGPRRRGRARSASTRCPKRRKNGESRRPRGAADRREGLPCSGNVPPARPSGTRFPLESMTSVARVHIVAIDPPAGRLTLDVKALRR